MLAEAYRHCETLVREADRDRFIASLFAPAVNRPHLFALYAFNIEIARTRDVAHDIMPGELRLQWWRDVFTGVGGGDVMANPVARALIDTLERGHISAQALIDLIEARRFDLYDEPIATLADLDNYARQTSSMLMVTAARVLGAASDKGLSAAADAAGMAYGIAGLLSIVALHAARGQIFVPHELLDRHDVRSEDILAGKTGPAWLAVLTELRAHARGHYASFMSQVEAVPVIAQPAFLPVALVPALLARMERRDYSPLSVTALSPLRRQWTIWRAARRGFVPDRG
jgi:phytoene synthase